MAPPQIVEFDITIHDALNKVVNTPFPNLTLTLKLPNNKIEHHKTNAQGRINIKLRGGSSGDIIVQDIHDMTALPYIKYTPAMGTKFPTNTTNFLSVPNKRKIIDRIASKHSIPRRSTWGKKTPKYTIMDADWSYTTVVLHHSGDGGAKDPKEIEKEHMGDKKWDDVGYHYMVDPSGVIYEGRYLSLKGSHVAKANTGKLGILVMGDFEHQAWDFDDDPTKKQLASVKDLIKTLKSEFGTLTKLGGHRDYKSTTKCPGGELYKMIPGIRTDTKLGGP